MNIIITFKIQNGGLPPYWKSFWPAIDLAAKQPIFQFHWYFAWGLYAERLLRMLINERGVVCLSSRLQWTVIRSRHQHITSFSVDSKPSEKISGYWHGYCHASARINAIRNWENARSMQMLHATSIKDTPTTGWCLRGKAMPISTFWSGLSCRYFLAGC